MSSRYWIFQRKGVFYYEDNVLGEQRLACLAKNGVYKPRKQVDIVWMRKGKPDSKLSLW